MISKLVAGNGRLETGRCSRSARRVGLELVETYGLSFDDSGIFNTSRGAIANSAGTVTTHASIVNEKTTPVKRPVRAARFVMEAGRHMLMMGGRREAYVKSLRAYFIKAKRGRIAGTWNPRCGGAGFVQSYRGGDQDRRLPQISGRVGNPPILGPGAYADDAVRVPSRRGTANTLSAFQRQ